MLSKLAHAKLKCPLALEKKYKKTQKIMRLCVEAANAHFFHRILNPLTSSHVHQKYGSKETRVCTFCIMLL